MKPVNILFICSCLEPGKDGVGDYTRKLACALINRGYTTAIAAINDRHMLDETIWQGEQQDENTMITVLRLSSSLSWNIRVAKAKAFVDEFNPGWISFQYVPFGFQIKGLPFNLGKKLLSIGGGRRWHIMFHELTVNKDASLKFRVWALLQEYIIKSLMQALKPGFVTTNAAIYKQRLQEMGYTANILPLFSNISRIENAVGNISAAIIPGYLVQQRNAYITGTLFGNFAVDSWNLLSLLDKLSNGYQNRKVVMASIGRMASGSEYWNSLKDQYPDITFLDFGMQEAGFISYWLLHYTDFGILTTPPELAGKSGTFMAYKEHGIPVVCRERTNALQYYNIPLDDALTEVPEDNQPFVLPPHYKPASLLDEAAQQFINGLTANGVG